MVISRTLKFAPAKSYCDVSTYYTSFSIYKSWWAFQPSLLYYENGLVFFKLFYDSKDGQFLQFLLNCIVHQRPNLIKVERTFPISLGFVPERSWNVGHP